MKKALKIMSVFILLVSLFSFCLTFNNKTEKLVYAAETEKCTNSDTAIAKGSCTYTASDLSTTYGMVTIYKEGKIKINYKYGYTELLVYAFSTTTGKSILRHLSGSWVEKGQASRERAINLSNYFNVDEKVTIQYVIIEFLTSPNYDSDGNVKNEGDYAPIYCNVDGGIKNCSDKFGKSDEQKRNARMELKISNRIQLFLNDTYVSVSKENVHTESSQLVYKGAKSNQPLQYSCPDETGTNCSSVNNELFVNNNSVFGSSTRPLGINVVISKTSSQTMDPEIENLIFETVIPILMALLGIGATVTGTMLGYQIVKSSDEPQERQEKIAHLKSIIIGIVVVFILLLAAEPVTNLVKEWLDI